MSSGSSGIGFCSGRSSGIWGSIMLDEDDGIGPGTGGKPAGGCGSGVKVDEDEGVAGGAVVEGGMKFLDRDCERELLLSPEFSLKLFGG